jgi:hypothetical protein
VSDFTVKIRNERQNLRNRIEWLEKGMKELINHYSYNTVPKEVRDIAQSYLDGEPTTADEFNESQQLEGIQLKEELESEYDNLNAEMEEGYDDVEKYREDHITIIEEEE